MYVEEQKNEKSYYPEGACLGFPQDFDQALETLIFFRSTLILGFLSGE